MRDVMRYLHYSIHTERAYCDWIARFVRFHQMDSRDALFVDAEKMAEEKLKVSDPFNPLFGVRVNLHCYVLLAFHLFEHTFTLSLMVNKVSLLISLVDFAYIF